MVSLGGEGFRRWIVGAAVLMVAGIGSVYAVDLSAWSDSCGIVLRTDSAGGTNFQAFADIENFPVLVRLTPDNFSGFAGTKPGGADVRFVGLQYMQPMGSTGAWYWVSLPYEIERWVDVPGDLDTAEIWVLSYAIHPNDSTQHIKMYWNNPDAADSSNGAAVFDTEFGFISVYHMNQSAAGTGTADVYTDATSNGYDGTDNVSMDPTAGIAGIGTEFNGTSDYITSPSFSDATITNKFTISAWTRLPSTSQEGVVVCKEDNGFADAGYGVMKAQWNNPSTMAVTDSQVLSSDSWGYNMPVDGTTWMYLVGNMSGTAVRAYVDGEQRAHCVDVSNPGNVVKATSPLTIGRRSSTAVGFLQGVLDEVRIENDQRSHAWINLCYQNQMADQTLVHIVPMDQVHVRSGISAHARLTLQRPSVVNMAAPHSHRALRDKGIVLYDLHGRKVAPGFVADTRALGSFAHGILVARPVQ